MEAIEVGGNKSKGRARNKAGLNAVGRRGLTNASTGAAEADFAWFLSVLRGGPVTRDVRPTPE